jgi:hypothetical protein
MTSVLMATHHAAPVRCGACSIVRHTDAPAIPLALGLARFYLGDAAGARQTLAGIRRGGRPDLRAQAALASVEASLGSSAAYTALLDELRPGFESA